MLFPSCSVYCISIVCSSILLPNLPCFSELVFSILQLKALKVGLSPSLVDVENEVGFTERRQHEQTGFVPS